MSNRPYKDKDGNYIIKSWENGGECMCKMNRVVIHHPDRIGEMCTICNTAIVRSKIKTIVRRRVTISIER